jgi:hypothetical protein
MGTHGIRLSTATFAFDAAGFSQLETALLQGAGKPNQAGYYPTGFFPEALAVVESAQNYSTSRELPLSQGLSDLCTSALKAAETLREQGTTLPGSADCGCCDVTRRCPCYFPF